MRAGLEPERLRLIVNQVGTEEFSGSDLGRLFGFSVYAKLPGAARELDDACSKGQLLGANSDYRVIGHGLPAWCKEWLAFPGRRRANRLRIWSLLPASFAATAGTSRQRRTLRQWPLVRQALKPGIGFWRRWRAVAVWRRMLSVKAKNGIGCFSMVCGTMPSS